MYFLFNLSVIRSHKWRMEIAKGICVGSTNIALFEIETFSAVDVSCNLWTISPNVSSNEHCKTFRGMTMIQPHFTNDTYP